MARQVLPIVGAVVGAYFGNPQLGYAIGSIIGNAVDPQVIKTPGIKDIPTQTAGEGAYRQVVYGTSWVNTTNIIDFGDVRRVKQRDRQGKGGGPVVESERLYRTYAIGLGEPFDAIRMIRRNGKIVYDVRPGSTIVEDSAAFAERFTFYSGSEDQLPDPDLEALSHNGVGNTPYYRGTAYLVFPDDDLTDDQGRIPTYEVEAVKAGFAIQGKWWMTGTDAGASGKVWVSESLEDWSGAVEITRSPNIEPTDSGVGGGGYYRLSETTAVMVNSDGEVEFIEGLDITDPVVPTVSSPLPGPAAYRVRILFGIIFVFTYAGSSTYYTYDTNAVTPTWNTRSAPALNCSDIGRINSRWVMFCQSGSSRAWYYSDDPGDPTSWTAGTGPNAGNVSGSSMVSMIGKALIYMGSGRVATTTTGAAWTLSGDIIPDDVNMGCHAYDGGNTIIGGDTNGTHIHVSTDKGTSWTSLPFRNCRRIDYYSGKWVFNTTGTAASLPGPYYSTDNGTTITRAANMPTTPGSSNNVFAGPILAQSTIETDTVILNTVIEDICDRCGIPSTEYDFSALTDELLGVTLGGPYDGASTAALFFAPYSFDLAQPDKVMKAVKRGAAVVETLTADDFIEGPDESILRGQDIEYPRALMLKYLDAGQNYAAPAATVSRTTPDSRVSGEATMELPISLPRNEAFQIADRTLKVMWEDLNGEIEFAVPSGRFCDMAAGDCYGLSLRGGLYRIRITEVTETPWQLKVKARRDRQSAYTSVLTGIPLPTPTPPPPALPGATTFALMDIPALVDADDSLGIYVAVTGQPNTAWYGAAVEYSIDGGTTYTSAGTITLGARMGELTAALPYAPEAYTDNVNTLAVELVTDDELESVTQVQFLSEGNPAAICYGDGTAEIVQFRDGVNTAGTAWDLTTLQRGRLGTSTVAHASGEQFVFLEDAFFVPLPSALIGQTIKFRITSLGTSPEVAPTEDVVWNAVCQTELPPANLILDLVGNDLTCTAVPRHRFGTEDAPVASINFRGYRWTATDGANSATADTTDPEYTFDVTGWSSPITVTVAQLNRWTGAGPSISENT